MINNFADDNNSSTGSFKGKFRDRLRLIKISRFKKIKGVKDNREFIQDRFREIERLSNDNDDSKIRNRFRVRVRDVKTKNISLDKLERIRNRLIIKVKDDERDRFVRGVIRRIRETAGDRDYVRRGGIGKKDQEKNRDQEKKVKDENEAVDDKDIVELKVKIVKKLENEFEKKKSELEVLESELYFLKECNDKEVELGKVKEIKEEIGVVIGKINNIIDEYDLYRNSYNIDDMMGIDNGDIVDDIINFKKLINNKNINDNDLVSNYKLLDEYRVLYDKLRVISTISDNLVVSNQERIEELNIRDQSYDEIKSKVVKVDLVLKKCDDQIDKQNNYIKNLLKKVENIDEIRYSQYKFVGVKELVASSVKYVSLLMISPLAGLVPSIAINTLVTRKMIKNIYKNMHIEKVNNVRYEAIDYDREIKSKLNDINYTYALIDDTLGVIDNLKSDFMLQYDSSLSGYSDTLRKIDTIKNNIMNNRYKMDIIKKNLVSSKKVNEDKMVKLRKLNDKRMV